MKRPVYGVPSLKTAVSFPIMFLLVIKSVFSGKKCPDRRTGSVNTYYQSVNPRLMYNHSES